MATDKEYQALIDSLSGECERLHKENEELKALSQECVEPTQKHVGNALDVRCDECRNKRTSFCGNCMHYDEFEPCDDAIDREYLFKVLDDFCGHDRTATITLDTLADLVYDMPTVTQKSVLEQIRAEIEQAYCKVTNDYDKGRNYGLFIAMQIIDKYNAEREDKE